jgi:hypothetical protein
MQRIQNAVIFGLLALFSATTLAEESSTVLTKIEGQPFIVQLSNGNEVEWKEVQLFLPLESTVTLSENSCTTISGLKIPYVVPMVTRVFIAYWKTHPRFQGQPVMVYDTDDKKMITKNQSAFVTRGNRASFPDLLKRVGNANPAFADIFDLALKDQWSEGWIACGKNCTSILPAGQTSALIWDENFESNNSQLSMLRSSEISINQVTSRYVDVEFSSTKSKLHFRRPGASYGFSSAFPMGLGYQLQWTFRAPNLMDTDDPVCQMKWDMDFTRIFTRFQELSDKSDDPEKLKTLPIQPYLFRAEDAEDFSIRSIFDPSEYNSEEFKK